MSITSPFDIIADLDTPVSVFMKLHDLKPCFLLESVESGERLARYSFLGFGDTVKIKLEASSLYVNDEIKYKPSNKKEYLLIESSDIHALASINGISFLPQ